MSLRNFPLVVVQPHTDSTVVRFPTARSGPFYTGTMGKWQQLDNGNMLLAETNAGRVVEATPDGLGVGPKPYNNSETARVPGIIRTNPLDCQS